GFPRYRPDPTADWDGPFWRPPSRIDSALRSGRDRPRQQTGNVMLHSANRILTTHTGSLPRPAALTSLYARRAAGEAVDEAAIETEGKAATRHVVRRQIAAGIDVGNNGEQQREAFFLYVRRRMTGFGGSWVRRPMADVVKYPGYRAWAAEQDGVRR